LHLTSLLLLLSMKLMLGFSTVNFLCISGGKGRCVRKRVCSCVCMHCCSPVVLDVYISW
jgi:hypothetical protein